MQTLLYLPACGEGDHEQAKTQRSEVKLCEMVVGRLCVGVAGDSACQRKSPHYPISLDLTVFARAVPLPAWRGGGETVHG
ncbi:hypothetical protein ABAC402_13915 [Asticcacaulis sp. AC402]|nr:hypothetical protein ABAC402_13915 [Asticcacaulis sp. AC402]